MIKLDTATHYIIFESKGKYENSFVKSPVLPITDDSRESLGNLSVSDEIIIRANEAGTESTYSIIDLQVNTNTLYPLGILQIFVVRSSAMITVLPGHYKRNKQANSTNPCGEQPLNKANWLNGMPDLNDIISVQPMSQPSGLAFYMDKICSRPNKNGDVFTKEAVNNAFSKWLKSKGDKNS